VANTASPAFNRLLDPGFVAQVVSPGSVQAHGVYQRNEGLQFRTPERRSRLVQEVVHLTDGALLLASDYSLSDASVQHQVVSDSDWIHIQFRLNGAGQECVSNTNLIETPTGSCVVVRYPRSSVVHRTTHATDSFRVACLLLNPKAVPGLLGIEAGELPKHAMWMARDDQLDLKAAAIPLSPGMRLAVNDILSCPFTGAVRRAYMRAKSMELLATVIHGLDNNTRRPAHIGVVISPSDVAKIGTAKQIISQEIGSPITLAALARRVGLNRTKLALGFKEIYGVSVQAYWRNERLCRAREYMQDKDARVTDVALRLGYELSSFTRAFSKKFGLLPGSMKYTRKSRS